MPPSRSRTFRSFMALNIAQVCTTLNDNLFKILLAFYLINLQGAEHSFTILSLAGGIFVVPFLLFAATSGTLADRFSKTNIIYVTRGLEILVTVLGVVAFYFQSVWGGYAVLFLLSVQSTLFSPCKYGIIPEIIPSEKIPHYNGIITASTYIAIIFGTFLASFLTQITNERFVLAALMTVLVAFIGAIGTLWLQKTPPQAPHKKISYSVIGEIWRTLKRAKKQRYLVEVIVFGAYFLFMAAYTQLNMIPYVIESLKMSQVTGGYIFLITAFGIGLGSYSAGQAMGKDAEIGLIPLACLGSGLSCLCLYWLDFSLYTAMGALFCLGFFGGFYVVPVDIFIQVASPDNDRGQNVAAANFLSFVGVILASVFLAVFGNFLGFSAAKGFAVIGILSCFLAVNLAMLFADQVLRLIIATMAKIFWDLKVVGKRRLVTQPPVVIVGQRKSWLDILIVMATLPRRVRYIVPTTQESLRHPLYYKLLKVIPLDSSCYAPIFNGALDEIEREIKQGHCVCIMHPHDTSAEDMKQWREKVEMWLHDVQVHALPLYITHEGSSNRGGRLRHFFTLFGRRVKVGFGLPID